MSLIKLQVKQVASLVNDATKQFLGDTAVLQEDLANVVDVGKAVTDGDLYENFTMGLILQIGEHFFVNRPYKSDMPNIYKTNREYGAITAKTRGKLDEASDNQSWMLIDQTSYDDNVYIESTYETKIFAKSTAFEIRKSIPNEQIKGCFKSPDELSNFVSMVYTLVYNSIEIKREALNQMVICNMIAETIYDNNPVRYVKLLTMYNTLAGTSLTDSEALLNKGFLAFASGRIRFYQSLMTRYSELYNINGAENHTPKELQHLILVSEFIINCDTFLDSDTFHNEFVKLPYHTEVPYWQGTGTDLSGCMTVNIKTASGHTVNNTKVLGCLFDIDALGINEDKPTVRVKFVNSTEFTNYWFKEKTSYFNDLNENMVVFTLE